MAKKKPTLTLTRDIHQGPKFDHCKKGSVHEIVDPPEDQAMHNGNGVNGFWILGNSGDKKKTKDPILIYHGEYQ